MNNEIEPADYYKIEEEKRKEHEKEIVYVYRKNETKKQLKWLLLIAGWVLFITSCVILGHLLKTVVNLNDLKDLFSLMSDELVEDIESEIVFYIIKELFIIISIFTSSIVCFKLSDLVKILNKE